MKKLRLVLGTEMKAKNKIQAIESLTVTVLTYIFVIIYWRQEVQLNMDRKTRKLLTVHGQNHSNVSLACMFPDSREEGFWCS